jgi:hypothetical protein
MALKDQLKQAADAIRKAADTFRSADDAFTKTVDEYASLATGLPAIGQYAGTAKALVDSQDTATDAVVTVIDLADTEVDKLTS